nr:hypothetical protein [Tanacetum cinerariifolium]
MRCGKEIEDILEIKLVETGHDQEIFRSESWSKLIKFRLARRDHSLTLLQFAKCLGLYFNKEVGEEGVETYFLGGLCSDEHFNAREYWLSNSREEDLHLSKIHASTIRKPIMRVLQKMISALDRITLRELIGPNRKLITKASMLGTPRVAMPVPIHPSMQDLYEMMGNIEIHQCVVERKAYRQSYQWDRVFEHMAGVYDIPLQGAYTHLGMIRNSISSIISSFSSSREMMMSSVKMTHVRVQGRLKEFMYEDSIFSFVQSDEIIKQGKYNYDSFFPFSFSL